MQIDERFRYITCKCGEKFQALKEYTYTDEFGRTITYIDVDQEELSRFCYEHLEICPYNK